MSIQPLPTVLFLALTLSSALCRAQDAAGAAAPLDYRFDDELVLGDTAAPTGEVLQVRTRGWRASLIRAREHWITELCKSVENL